jgi:hypothetical protein
MDFNIERKRKLAFKMWLRKVYDIPGGGIEDTLPEARPRFNETYESRQRHQARGVTFRTSDLP